MSGPRRLLLSAAHLQTISQAARHQLRTRRRPIQFSSASQICQSTRTFTSCVRLRQDKPKKDDGAATLPEETTNIARSQDEPPKPSDLDAIPEDTPASELAEAIEEANAKTTEDQDVKSTEATESIEEYLEEDAEVNERGVGAEPQRIDEADTATILKHGDSEAHQDLREYARLAAWELPLLHSMYLRKGFGS
jgi:hypothetical protein